MQNQKIPVVVGVTGDKNIVEADKPAIMVQVKASLKEIQDLCRSQEKGGEDTPVVMLNSFAHDGDMLCAEAAFEAGIDVYAILPCEKEKYINSFDNATDKAKLESCLAKAKRQFVAPDIEKNKAWIKKTINIDDDSYEYRQLGIYMAEHSHVLIALWNGEPPEDEYGCGTEEVIKFALEHKFLDKDKLFKPGMINDSAVIWIKSCGQGDGTQTDIRRRWLISDLGGGAGEHYKDYLVLDESPAFLNDIVSKTVAYNDEKVDISPEAVKLWKDVDELDEYRKTLRLHYAKADELSYTRNQKKYNAFILLLALVGTLVASTFLIYDDASLPFMIFPCTAAIGILIWLIAFGKRKAYHKKYIEYRVFAEALRIQFYTSMCLAEKTVVTNVCDLYAWSQKVDMVWIDKAIKAIGVICESEKIKIDASNVIDVWIGNHEKPTGQLKYHNRKKETNRQKAKLFDGLSRGFQTATLAIYFLIFIFEIVAYAFKANDISWFWEGTIFAHVSWRNFAAIVLGSATAGSLLASSYWGKLSYGRKLEDNEKMSILYASAYERWNEVKNHSAEIEKFVKEIAREEIVENGIWCSYVNENGLEINI